jgi:hypothetical protein
VTTRVFESLLTMGVSTTRFCRFRDPIHFCHSLTDLSCNGSDSVSERFDRWPISEMFYITCHILLSFLS